MSLKHIYLGMHFSEGLICNAAIEAEQKYNTESNILYVAEEVKNEVNERFNKAPWSHEK